MEEITFRHDLQIASIQVGTIEVFVIWIFSFLLPICQEINDTGSLVYFHYLVYMPRTFRNTVFQLSVSVIKIKVSPAIPFAPLHQLFATVQYCQRAHLLVSIHAFLDQRADRIFAYGIRTDINPIQVTAGTGQIEMVTITQPFAGLLAHIPLFLQTGLISYAEGLILICLRRNLLISVVLHIEKIQMLFRCLFLSRHLIFVSFQSRTRRSHCIDDPQLLHLTFIRSGNSKITGIGRPQNTVCSFALPIA